MELFTEKGFPAISIQDITERATVNRATFYAHFADKYELMDSIIREQFQRNLANHLSEAPGWSKQSLSALVKATVTFLSGLHYNCKPSNRQFDPLMERALQQELADILLTWLKQAKVAGLRQGMSLETVASVVSWSIFGTTVQWSRGERSMPADELAKQIVLIITDGLTHLAPGFLPA